MPTTTRNLETAIRELAVALKIENMVDELLVYAVKGDVGEELGKRLNAGDEACRRAVEVVFQADKRSLSHLRSRHTEPAEA